ALIVLGALPAAAHLGHVVTRAERYLKLDAEPEGVRLVVSLTLGPRETVRVMRAADADGDEVVTQAEADAYMAQWGEGLLEDLPVEVDGEPRAVAWGEPYFAPIGPVQAVNGAVEMVAHVPLAGGRHRVTLRDRMRIETFDRTDVAFEAQPGATLVACGAGAEPEEVEARFAYVERNAPEQLTTIVEVPGAPEPASALPYVLAGGAVLVLGLVGWLAVLRRRR
ncbi:MAG: hypothetical protein CMH59_18390, partial [Myxococcales bacterium]|nr:hypothetical protein [Myxococcales bacterium]